MMGCGSLSLLAVLALFNFCHAHQHVVWFSRNSTAVECTRSVSAMESSRPLIRSDKYARSFTRI